MKIRKNPVTNIELMVDAITEEINSKPKGSVIRRQMIIKMLELYDELPQEERIMIIEHFCDEHQYKKMVEHPEFINKQSNAWMKVIMFGGITMMLLILTSAIFFSDSAIAEIINSYVARIYYFTGGR